VWPGKLCLMMITNSASAPTILYVGAYMFKLYYYTVASMAIVNVVIFAASIAIDALS